MTSRKLILTECIERAILLIRGQKVMLDHDLAALYGVTTGNLNKAVQRNLDRFPPDFMFRLTPEEAGNLRFQIGISSSSYGGRRYMPYAFTGHVKEEPIPYRAKPQRKNLRLGI